MKLHIKSIFNSILICFTLMACSPKNDKIQFIIEGKLIPSEYGYTYNPDGFINTPYGKVTISTKTYFKNGKLTNLLWNRANGFLEYSVENLKNDSKFYQSLKVDSLFSKNETKFLDWNKTIRNDTVFYKKNQKIIIVDL